MSQKSTPKFKKILSIVTVVVLILFMYALRDEIAATLDNLQNINPWAIALIPLLQLVNYHSYTQMYREIFAFLGEKLRYRSMFRVQLELNFVNTLFPSGGVSGISYFGLRMRDADVSPGKSTLVQVMKFLMVFVSFQIWLGLGLLILAIGGKASSLLILIVSSIVTLLFVGTILMAYILGSQRRINTFFTELTKFVNRVIHVFRRKHPETINVEKVRGMFTELHEGYILIKKDIKVLKKPFGYALLANAAEIMTLYSVYMAFGEFVNIGAVIIAYAVANFAGLISVLPGGVGIYEGLMTAVLAAGGVPATLSLPVTVTYRIINAAVQLPIGYFYYNKSLRYHKVTHESFTG